MVVCRTHHLDPDHGLVVGFNKKGEGGRDFVHVLVKGSVQVYMHFHVTVISRREKVIFENR